DFSTLADNFGALNSTQRLDAEQAESFSRARFQELRTIEAASGVDTDQEMQKLLLIEQAYAANSRVVSTIDQMLQTLMEI
ncbi:MAG: flagellar basal body rod C-terminal domain-containing protein, partial [Paracoccaceae bacterium]